MTEAAKCLDSDCLPVVTQLHGDAPAFDFFQAVRLLRLAAHQQGQSPTAVAEAVRFRTNPSLEFPASAVQALESGDEPGQPDVMTVNFLGVHGANGALPRHYSELIRRLERERRDSERGALRAWFDLFNNRLVNLFYEAWEKYRFWLAAERGAWNAAEPDAFTQCLRSLCGLGSGGLQRRFRLEAASDAGEATTLAEIRDEALLRYGGLLAQRKRNAVGLEQMLTDYFGCPVTVLQFQGRWLPLTTDCQTRLGDPGEAGQLGVGAVVGDRIWDVESMIRIRVGPLRYAEFLEFMPDASVSAERKSVFLLNRLTRFYVGVGIDWEVQLVLRGEETPPCRLGSELPGPRLGWNTWLDPEPRGMLADDAVFTSSECDWQG